MRVNPASSIDAAAPARSDCAAPAAARTGRGLRNDLSLLLPLAYFGALLLWGVLDFVGGEPFSVAYQLLALGYLAAMAATYLLPGRRAARAAGGWWGRLVALASANLLIPLSLLPVRPLLPEGVALPALFAATLFSWWALLTLRSA